MNYTLGIDAGSTTLKLVVLDEMNQVVYKSYERHYSQIKPILIRRLEELRPLLEKHILKIVFTGSAGVGYATQLKLPFVQEVFGTALAVEKLLPEIDVVIELGGEDAKLIFLTGGLEERMNSSCAGGTGAFIDQMASLMHVSVDTLDELSLQADQLYPIASRCGVFAKSDIQPLLNQGAKKEAIAASIFQAVVDQTIGGLAQGRSIKGNVLFLGGPLHFYKGLQKRFIETLHLSEEQSVFTENAQVFVAIGAALYAKETEGSMSYEMLLEALGRFSTTVQTQKYLPPLFTSESAYETFSHRHQKASVPCQSIENYKGDVFLGIDAGSTTTKMVLIDEAGAILYQYYASNKGNPIQVVREQLLHIYQLYGDRIRIASTAVTGYGEELIKEGFHIDYGIVETLAHYTAAHYFNPQVDFILDIGGQDIKCFKIEKGVVTHILLNEACSSGCGSFIESFALQLGYSIEDFARLGLYAEHPVDLGSRCTVFMNSSVKEAQKNGATLPDIAAGLAISVVKNAIYKVIRASDSSELGQHIVVQGGTLYNDAILRSLELELDREVIRPNVAGLMGAYGCALYAKNHGTHLSSVLSHDELVAFKHFSQVAQCKLCHNKCTLTINTFNGHKRYISGNKCSKPEGHSGEDHLPNLYAYKYNLLKALSYTKGWRKETIGIPLALNMYENLPFWHAFFATLGFNIKLSGPSNKKLYTKGQHTIPSDTICYPAKLTHGHILQLIEEEVPYIFYPCMSYNFDEKLADNCYNCPVVAYYPEVISANMEAISKVTMISPYLSFNEPKQLAKNLFEALHPAFKDITLKHIKGALEKAYQAYHSFHEALAVKCQESLAYAKAHQLPIAILCGRPYHIDPEINHGIDKLLTSLGVVVISEDALKPMMTKPSTQILNQWTYQARMYGAAYEAGKEPLSQLIQLVSFGCGTDAVTTDEMNRILAEVGKMYTQLKIDETANLGAAKIRIRSMLAATSLQGEMK
ncbi:MAG: acyl-CoA dehydratase activase-related protein [Cellulosilyticaceae bacterium]